MLVLGKLTLVNTLQSQYFKAYGLRQEARRLLFWGNLCGSTFTKKI